MDPIRPAAILPSSPVVDAPQRPAVQPIGGGATSGTGAERQVLDPAVSVEFSADAAEVPPAQSERRSYERDAQTEALVFRVTDMANGDVIVQIPDEVVLKARAYLRQDTVSAGERVERHA